MSLFKKNNILLLLLILHASLAFAQTYSLTLVSKRKVGMKNVQGKISSGEHIGIKGKEFSIKYGAYAAKDYWKFNYLKQDTLFLYHSTNGLSKKIAVGDVKFILTRLDTRNSTKRGRMFSNFLLRLLGLFSNNLTKDTEENRQDEKKAAKEFKTVSKHLIYSAKIQKYRLSDVKQ